MSALFSSLCEYRFLLRCLCLTLASISVFSFLSPRLAAPHDRKYNYREAWCEAWLCSMPFLTSFLLHVSVYVFIRMTSTSAMSSFVSPHTTQNNYLKEWWSMAFLISIVSLFPLKLYVYACKISLSIFSPSLLPSVVFPFNYASRDFLSFSPFTCESPGAD